MNDHFYKLATLSGARVVYKLSGPGKPIPELVILNEADIIVDRIRLSAYELDKIVDELSAEDINVKIEGYYNNDNR
jgi:hypothetical protein